MFIGIFRFLQARSSNDDDFQTLSRSNRFKFGIFLGLQLIALICSILNFLQYYFRCDLRKSLSYDLIYCFIVITSVTLHVSCLSDNRIDLFVLELVSLFFNSFLHFLFTYFFLSRRHLSLSLSKHVRLSTMTLYVTVLFR